MRERHQLVMLTLCSAPSMLSADADRAFRAAWRGIDRASAQRLEQALT